ncbi:MAG: ABC transporter substrate-binding protein [Gammaproteobacteria bacterium]|nr:ABC transporter substrate-binding protein [Gammaproteobacteria bacterium]
MAFVISPLAMSMYTEKPDFRWKGLMHRDGNALAINDSIYERSYLPPEREDRKPDDRVAKVLGRIHSQTGKSTVIGVPHLFSTHKVVLYRYLKESNLILSLKFGIHAQVLAIPLPPLKPPAFINAKSNRAQPAAFEQSLPWADVLETGSLGHLAWHSKGVMPWKHGHVECMALAKDESIRHKRAAVGIRILKTNVDIDEFADTQFQVNLK